MSVVRILLPLVAAQILLLPADCVGQSLRIRTITKIAVGHQPNGMSLTGTELYVTNLRDGTVSIIDIRSNSVRRTLQTCKEPWVVAITPDRTRAFVGCRDGVAVITIATKQVTFISCCGWVWDLAITADSQTVYIAGQRSGLFRMDARSLQVVRMDAATAPMKLTITPDGRFLYVNYMSGGPGGEWGHDAIGQFDISTGKLVRTILHLASVGGPLAISPNGKLMWANGTDACMSRRYDHEGCPIVPAGIINIIRLPTHELVHRIPWLRANVAQRITFSPSGRFVAINGTHPACYDALTFRVLGTVPGFETIDWVFAQGDDHHAYTSLENEAEVAVLEITPDKT